MIRIKREEQKEDSGAIYSIVVDGIASFSLKNGEDVNVDLSVGTHTITISSEKRKSKQHTIQVGENQMLEYLCYPAKGILRRHEIIMKQSRSYYV